MITFYEVTPKMLIYYALIFMRMSGLVLTMPFFGGEQIPKVVRLALITVLSMFMFLQLDLVDIPIPTSSIEYVVLFVKEIGIGVVLGTVASLVFFAVQLGGEIVGIEMGLNSVQAIDPLSQTSIPTFGQFLLMFMMTIFLLMNGHHYLLTVFLDSFYRVPLLQANFSVDLFDYILSLFNVVIEVGMRLALPVMAVSFCQKIVFGFMARLVPQMNVFILSVPIQIIGGILVFTACLPFVVLLFRDTLGEVVDELYRVLVLMKPV